MALRSMMHDMMMSDEERKERRQNYEPARYPLDDEQEEEIYADYSRALLEERYNIVEGHRLTWTQNLLYLAGLQWWNLNNRTGLFEPDDGPEWKERPVRNILQPYARFVMAKLTKERPRTSCVPGSTDPDDIHAAELGDEVLKSLWTELGLTKKLREAIAWMIPTGNAFIHPYWNESSGKLKPITAQVETTVFDEAGRPVGEQLVEAPCDAEGNPIMTPGGSYDLDAEPAYIDEGEVGIKILSPFQVFVDEDAHSDDDVQSVIVTEALTLREIYRRWPEAGDVQSEDTTEIDRFDNIVVDIASGPDNFISSSQYQRADRSEVPKALVIHYYEKPNTTYPHGRYWASAGRTLLEAPGMLPDNIWPIVIHLKDMEAPGHFLGESAMTAAVGLQKEYNEISGQIKEHHNIMLRGKWLVPLGANINRGQITSRPGEVIQHTPGLEPQMVDMKALPVKVYEERDKVMLDFEFITGAHKVSMGDAPAGVTSGRAFLTLQEADDTDLGPTVEMVEESVAKLSWLMLQLVQQYYEEERMLRVSGGGRSFTVRAFRGADLDSIVDVEPQVGSAFPWSKTAKQSMFIELARAVPMVFQDPETGIFDIDRFRSVLPVGGEEAVGQASDADVNEALREEEEFETWDGQVDEFGDPMPPLPAPQQWQHHAAHLRQHAKLLKSASFKRWPPQNQQAFMDHYGQTNIAFQLEMSPFFKTTADAQNHPQAIRGTNPDDPDAAPMKEGEGMPPEQGPSIHRSEKTRSNPGTTAETDRAQEIEEYGNG